MIKRIGYLVASCIILVAMLVATSRLLTPVLDEHRQEIETWASSLLQTPVAIKHVRLSWYRYQPEVCLDEVTLLNKETNNPLLQIKKVSVFFSIPRSLWNWKLIPSGIMISGAGVNIYEKPNGEIAVQGFPSLGGFSNQPYQSETKFADMLSWLSQLPSLILNDVDLRYTGMHGLKRFLTLYNLRFENTSTKHIILGKAILHQALPTEVNVTVKWEGEKADLNSVTADIYLSITGLSLSQWWKGLEWNGWQLNDGQANAKIWAIWSRNTFQKIQCSFESYGLDLYSATDKSTHKVSRFSGDVGWKREGANQIFAGEDIFIDLPVHLWPVTSFYVAAAPDATGKLLPTAIKIGYFDLVDAQSFVFSSPAMLSNEMRQLVTELKLRGEVQNFSYDVAHTVLNANFGKINIAPWHKYPGVHNLAGQVKWDGSQGDLTLQSRETVFHYDTLFSHSLTIDQLSGHVTWLKDQDKKWQIRLKELQALSQDLALNVSGAVTIPPTDSPSLDIDANFTMQDAERVTQYLPMKIFDPSLVTWLDQAFLSGVIQSGKATVRGQLKDFPFDNGNGVFQVMAKPQNLNFRFAPDWPILTNLSAELIFSGRQMKVEVDHAEIEGIPVGKVHAEIPYLGDGAPQILTVQTSDISSDFAKGLQFVHRSPLEENIGKMFTDTEIKGPMILKLLLTVPLSHPENTTVQGDIDFKNTQLNLVPWDLVINNMHGQLQFTEKSTAAQNIEGELFGKPLLLQLKTIDKAKNLSVVRAVIANKVDIVDIEHWLKLPSTPMVAGATDLAATIDFSLSAPVEVHLASNLVGMEMKLPDQYAKKPKESRDFTADITIQEKQPLRVKMNYGAQLGAAMMLNKKNGKFNLTSVNLRLGNGEATWPTATGLYITGNLEKLDWDKIKSYMGQSDDDMPGDLTLEGIDVTIHQLDLPGQPLMDTRIQVVPTDTTWDLTLDGPTVKGQIQVPVKFNQRNVLNAQFQKLKLVSALNAKTVGKFDSKSLPSMTFTANNVTYNDMPLGQVSFKTTPSTSGLAIKSLTVNSSRLDFSASGDWTNAGTKLQGRASSPNVSGLLNSLGFDTHNFVSGKGRCDFNLVWGAAPYDLSLATMNGRASLDLGAGRIVELSQTSGAKMDLGRMLSLFSLQTIPRRLSLDFSDVFEKGYSFDLFKGDFKFENGDAYTSNTRFDGPVARVDIYGRLGLAKKDYDLTMSVTPHVTSSIPVAATLLTGQPVIGIAAWAVDKVISPGVTKATTYYYAVNGPWSNPQWNSISQPQGQ